MGSSGFLHSVFTLPHELNDLILHNKRVLLNLLFRAVQQTLHLFAKDPKYGLVGQLGFTSGSVRCGLRLKLVFCGCNQTKVLLD